MYTASEKHVHFQIFQPYLFVIMQNLTTLLLPFTTKIWRTLGMLSIDQLINNYSLTKASYSLQSASKRRIFCEGFNSISHSIWYQYQYYQTNLIAPTTPTLGLKTVPLWVRKRSITTLVSFKYNSIIPAFSKEPLSI